jgi:hypothetical protein
VFEVIAAANCCRPNSAQRKMMWPGIEGYILPRHFGGLTSTVGVHSKTTAQIAVGLDNTSFT